jgi:hypothetical protein
MKKEIEQLLQKHSSKILNVFKIKNMDKCLFILEVVNKDQNKYLIYFNKPIGYCDQDSIIINKKEEKIIEKESVDNITEKIMIKHQNHLDGFIKKSEKDLTKILFKKEVLEIKYDFDNILLQNLKKYNSFDVYPVFKFKNIKNLYKKNFDIINYISKSIKNIIFEDLNRKLIISKSYFSYHHMKYDEKYDKMSNSYKKLTEKIEEEEKKEDLNHKNLQEMKTELKILFSKESECYIKSDILYKFIDSYNEINSSIDELEKDSKK